MTAPGHKPIRWVGYLAAHTLTYVKRQEGVPDAAKVARTLVWVTGLKRSHSKLWGTASA